MVRVPLLGALLLLLASALTVSLVPAGLALDRRVTAELRQTAVEDLGRAPMMREDRNAQRAEALSMHAMTVAAAPGLMDALGQGRVDRAVSIARDAASAYGEDPVLVDRSRHSLVGPSIPDSLLASLRPGHAEVAYVYQDGVPRAVGLMALGDGGEWSGAAGSSRALDETMAAALAALSRAAVTIVGLDGAVVASTLGADTATVLARTVSVGAGRAVADKVSEQQVFGAAVWVASGPVAHAGIVLFSREVSQELAALPAVRRAAVVAGALTLVLALAVGAVVAFALTRSVRGLAEAATRVADGDFEAPVPPSRIEELDRLGRVFLSMRDSLRSRIEELGRANRALEDRQDRLHDLQAELIRQDRLRSSARMAAELAHEIRNPVANVRNCLEVVRRGLPEGSEGSGFADMAIDELLRMHELAEQLLDLNRPADPGEGVCVAAEVTRQVATLAGVGEDPVRVTVRNEAPEHMRVVMPPDALKQILFNLVENAREAAGPEARVEVRVIADGSVAALEVLDHGPGIPEDALERLFDPFFTTKGAVHGVGLGLFVAEGLARRYGGRMTAENRTEVRGARFRLEVPIASPAGTWAPPADSTGPTDARGSADARESTS